jgi:hypothetical protein
MRRLAWGLVLAVVLAAGCGGEGGGRSASDDPDRTESSRSTTDATGSGTGSTGASAATAQDYVDALVAASEGSGLGDSPEQNRCFAQAYVDTVGVDTIAAKLSVDDIREMSGATPDEMGIVVFTPEQRDAFYGRLQTCSDIKSYFVGVFTGGSSNLSPAQVDCLRGALDDPTVEVMVTAPFDGDTTPIEQRPDFTAAIGRLAAACPDAMAAGGF